MLKMKKYPLLITTIISCVIVVASLFILGFFGMKLGTSLGGGSQFEIAFEDESKSAEYTNIVKDVLSENGLTVDSVFVEDKFIAGEKPTEFTTKCLIVKVVNEDVSKDVQLQVKSVLAEKLGVEEAGITDINNITGSVSSKNILFVGLAVGIMMLLFFVFGWARYDIFAGLSFIVAYLHNLIVYLSILILTRVELSLMSLVIAIVVTMLMSVFLIQMFEKFREQTKLHIDDKLSITEKLILCEKQAAKPFMFIALAIIVFVGLMFVVPVRSVLFSAINILISLVVACYTATLIAPAIYSALAEIRSARKKAVLSRNDTVNKVIKKKIAKNSK